MELTQNRRRAVTSYTLADAQVLNTIKNQLRDVTRILDASGKVGLYRAAARGENTANQSRGA
jgi:hypothetical protein